MIKLIASDIDGTLVPEGSHEISPEYFKVIEDLREIGIRFCACSGRQYPSMLDLFRPISDDIFFISGNGTVLRTKDNVLHTWPLDKDLVLQLIEAVRGIEGANFVVENPDRSFMDCGEDSDFMKMLRDGYHYDVQNVDDVTSIPLDNIVKVSIYCDDVEPRTEELRHDPRFAKMNMLISGAKWLDVTAIEAGKGEAYALLQEYLGIGIEETVYFGDNLNDLSAFRETGVALTVANARRELKDAADIVERSFSKMGVLRELRNILGHARDYLAANDELD